ncbi:GNAT family N-acetyltransferase [Mesorhizobium sp. M2D.F.Ca.ET.185.01.1.1]|uniref:GNAT family N-acetyltransferase n=1 Tax=unclassified Mesorhizobium TaxID=325217 RepID=UPI000FCC54F9|nr:MULTISPECIES: GNAT family N-acetyltransferase [unclassified Mesorhizobium]TGP80800.1 GNAT family N-acetyltransferase [bacterium M00.F.Ca.ET.227.01.1.1]TGP90584.1 GNAT family N-acetyltransferase [bacterium M00.F.Ca.ET.221.01.1.1]TGP97263.1 GNAT family N-acetyltransferase [bacterium M00.F.Ca.ET.222.01.1.1]TGU02074.1 GNAT family N-acetyltransferase [bacterium M00.F.Ca.ET.163.01.1.1]TGU26133.1 GNAT family N-acetyltransferase [bacterium M00.F.Ca.ET.156.01.1.1]TGU46957.1 GNAT family N-acetyltran
MRQQATDFLLRPGTIDDVEVIYAALLRLSTHIGAHQEIKSTADDLRRYGFGEKPAFATLIAEVSGEFAGLCLHFPIFSTWMGRPGVYVQDLYVEDRFRGRRIGEKLLRRVAKECRAAGGVYLRLSVDTDNETAKAFYERLGIGWSSYEQVQKIVGDAFFAFADGEE